MKHFEAHLATIGELDADMESLGIQREPLDAALEAACKAVAPVERRQVNAATIRKALALYISSQPGGAEALAEYEETAAARRKMTEAG